MSQEESFSTATLPPEEPTPVDPEVLVSTYADSLITELFDDVDKILDGDEAALAAVELAPEPSSTAIAPIVDTPVQVTDSSATDTALAVQDNELDFFTTDDVKVAPISTKTRAGQLFDRLLLSITALSLLGIGALLWFGQQGNRWGLGRSPSPETIASQSDEEFLAYLQRSLDVIASQVERGDLGANGLAQVPAGAALPPTPMLPPMGAGGPVGSLGAGPINVIERVYIPYQTAQPTPPVVPPLAIPQPGIAGVPNGVGTPPMPSQPVAPASIHALVGILELGARSAALFEINGVSQRVYIGERIGSSGWSLVSVSNEEAVVRRNGEVRSIYIGQRF
jgi:hypothetical protein